MRRSNSAANVRASRISTTPAPWETEDINQVPHLDGRSPALSQTEIEALPSLWATRTYSISNCPARMHSKSQSVHEFNSVSVVQAPLTAPPPTQKAQRPQLDIPRPPKSEPNLPSFAKPPSSPPDNTSQDSSSTGPNFGSPIVQQGMMPLPGTMTSRKDETRSRGQSSSNRSDLERRKSLFCRCREVLRELFTHHPVDESQFERMHERHWADDDDY